MNKQRSDTLSTLVGNVAVGMVESAADIVVSRLVDSGVSREEAAEFIMLRVCGDASAVGVSRFFEIVEENERLRGVVEAMGRKAMEINESIACLAISVDDLEKQVMGAS